MPVTIDEVTSEVEPPAPRSGSDASGKSGQPPEAEQRRQAEILARLARRAARLKAD
jgi:hypothetical protein